VKSTSIDDWASSTSAILCRPSSSPTSRVSVRPGVGERIFTNHALSHKATTRWGVDGAGPAGRGVSSRRGKCSTVRRCFSGSSCGGSWRPLRGLSRRRSRVRVPSLRRKHPANRDLVVGLGVETAGSRRPPGLFRTGNQPRAAREKCCKRAFLLPVGRSASHWSSVIPRRSRARLTGLVGHRATLTRRSWSRAQPERRPRGRRASVAMS
jgi:hypothetical protein